MSGLCSAVLIAAGLMVVGARFTWIRGPRTEEAFAEDALDVSNLDLDLDELATIGVPSV